jgi:hypothetical protein
MRALHQTILCETYWRRTCQVEVVAAELGIVGTVGIDVDFVVELWHAIRDE